jgi:hypothetical protein
VDTVTWGVREDEGQLSKSQSTSSAALHEAGGSVLVHFEGAAFQGTVWHEHRF